MCFELWREDDAEGATGVSRGDTRPLLDSSYVTLMTASLVSRLSFRKNGNSSVGDGTLVEVVEGYDESANGLGSNVLLERSYHSEEAWLRTESAHVHRFTSWWIGGGMSLRSKQWSSRNVMAGRVWENRKHGSRQHIEIERSKACPSFLPTVPLFPSVVAHLRMRILLT